VPLAFLLPLSLISLHQIFVHFNTVFSLTIEVASKLKVFRLERDFIIDFVTQVDNTAARNSDKTRDLFFSQIF